MIIFKKTAFLLFLLYILYVVFLYSTGTRETLLIPEGYEGPLLIIANQKDGIEINRSHTVYDFTKNNIIKLKGDLITGFSPWGYLNYYKVSSNGKKTKIKEIFDNEEKAHVLKDNVFIWGYYFEIGGCTAEGYRKTDYESFIVSKLPSIEKILNRRDSLVNEFVCQSKTTR